MPALVHACLSLQSHDTTILYLNTAESGFEIITCSFMPLSSFNLIIYTIFPYSNSKSNAVKLQLHNNMLLEFRREKIAASKFNTRLLGFRLFSSGYNPGIRSSNLGAEKRYCKHDRTYY
jgi:hypothetical protein